MGIIRVLIVDDEPLARRGIRRLLERETDFEIAGEAGNGQTAFAKIASEKPDLVFLDIQMPLAGGFSLVEKISVSAKNPPEIVFVTAYDEHAIQAFEAGALDYVLKPIDPERFQKTLERVRRRIGARETPAIETELIDLLRGLAKNETQNAPHAFLERIPVKESGRVFFIDARKIDWIGAQGNYIEIRAGREKHLLRETMDGIESKLNPSDFLRIRRSTIVRIEKIKELQPLFNGEFAVILQDGTELSSSRRYRKNLEAILKF
ncbi:MAG TPA: LytTR family DNA-binding domain-containing protein [Pyrinomonadaceae bacterium]|jgi:two-component system LytT family response regulator